MCFLGKGQEGASHMTLKVCESKQYSLAQSQAA